MPFIKTITNREITKEKESLLRDEFGSLISRLPGKSEEWLMLEFCDNCRMAFRGVSDRPVAMVEVSVYGSSTDSAYASLTEGITAVISEALDIEKNMIYVKYAETGIWGYSGFNI